MLPVPILDPSYYKSILQTSASEAKSLERFHLWFRNSLLHAKLGTFLDTKLFNSWYDFGNVLGKHGKVAQNMKQKSQM